MAELSEITACLDQVKNFSPLQRMLLTATGTLQGMLSAYFGEEVKVEVQEQRYDHDLKAFKRSVNLVTNSQMVCQADSALSVTRSDVRDAVEQQQVGIGQILEQLGIRPSFSLVEVGRVSTHFWRMYQLEAPGVIYRITESFPRELYP